MNPDKYKKQKKIFKKAYALGDKRLKAGYGWPLEVDAQLVKFFGYIKKSLSEGNVLDLGCGQGRHTIFFAQKGFNAYGIDYVKRAVDEAKQSAKEKNLKNANFKVMDAFKLDFPKNFFDIIIDWSVLGHIKPEDWNIYLKNILNALKTKGFFILAEFSANDLRIKNKTRNFFEHENHYDHYFREDEIKDLFSKNFKIISMNETMLIQKPDHLMLNVLMRRKK
ncbi:hypothetical protein CMO93_06010 [Candidatus Woesearchaeota archaeon]|nr:hypothetical protein [Candidatus Woesearchaeota archaeon]|tara:strand:- start:466 stop:1131 length:666 start_codon:yes stop_codon:yes gene_type:complete